MLRALREFLKRRRYLVNRELQLALLTRTVFATMAVFAIVAVALVLPLVQSLQTLDPDSEEQAEMATLLLHLHEGLVPVALLTIVAAVLCSLRSSHRIAGPLFSMMRTVGRIREGVIPARVYTRSGDYLGAEAKVAQEVLDGLRERITGIQRASKEIQAAVAGAGADARMKELAQRLDAAVSRLEVEGATLDEPAEPGVAPSPTSSSSRTRGFTLIEMMIVLAVIAILASIGIPKYFHAVENARILQAISDIKRIDAEIEEHRTRYGGIPLALPAQRTDPWGRPYVYVPWASMVTLVNGRATFVEEPAPDTKKRKKKRKPPAPGDEIVVDDDLPFPDEPEYELVNREYDLYSAGPDGKSAQALEDAESRDDVIRGDDGGYLGLARKYARMYE